MDLQPVIALRIVVLVVFVVFSVGVWWRIAIYRQGEARTVNVLSGLSKAPRRYFVDLHHKVDRDRYSSVMHVSVAGGFVLAGVFLLMSLAAPAVQPIHFGGLLGAILMLCGAGMTIWRRVMRRAGYPAARSGGAWARFGIWCVLAGVGFLLWFWTNGESWTAAVVLGVALAVIVGAAPWRNPLRHAIAGFLNLAFHPRPERFADGQGRDTGLKPLDLDAPRLGVVEATDWDWSRRLNFDACVQCGRCEAACPAFAAGQPLNPKALIQDVIGASGLKELSDPYAGNGHGASPTSLEDGSATLLDGHINADTIWSCTTCRACVEECPMMIEHVDAVVDLRRAQVLENGDIPGTGAAVISKLQTTDTASGSDLARRFDWASGLDLPRVANTGSADLLLWAGDAAFDARGQRTLRALVALLRHAGLNPHILGEQERDSGDLARRLGDEATFQRLAKLNVQTLNIYKIGRIVTADPHVLHVMTTEYPAFGSVPPIVHHTQLLSEIADEGTFDAAKPMAKRVTYHDPCYLGRYSGEFAAPRKLLDLIGLERVEMERSGHRSRCCGGGGGAPITDIPSERRIPDMRMGDVEETGATCVAVACPNCAVMLEGVSSAQAEVADVAELLARALELD